MKIINNRNMAQAMLGANDNTAAILNDPNGAAGWSIFAYSGKLPTSKEGFDAAFNIRSIADMYNNAIGIVRSPITGLENGNVIAMALQSQYIPKGVSYYGTVGSAALVVSQLTPARITRSGVTDRNITVLTALGTTNVAASRFASADIDFEFDTPVTVTHVKYTTTPATLFTLVALSDDGQTEFSLGTTSAIAGDSTCLAFATPRAAKKYRYKNAGSAANTVMRTLLSSVDVPTDTAATAPTWAVLAHCNTLAHGDIDYSDEVMFAAAAVGAQGPFKIVGDIVPSARTIMYCPKLRFSQRTS